MDTSIWKGVNSTPSDLNLRTWEQIEVALPRELTQRQRELLEEFRKEEYQKSEALKQKAA